ncbi:hypothetical protein ACWCQL_21470 [Streptomyces sp. NPDC002073]|uniref:hypothetical protein n=1 Tax=Streptomyces sp. NBC_00239 TaxID=2903640 RepID=UPI002E27BF69|nr:hypothetical protein [Streptomyces sp. NBC_00239]
MNAQTPASGLVNDPELRKELDATLAARRELGPEYEPALVESFLAKVEARLDGSLDTHVRRRLAEQRTAAARGAGPGSGQAAAAAFGEKYGFGLVSLVLAIPLSAIGAGSGGLTGLLISWGGILGVNFAHSARNRLGRGRTASEWD